MSDEGEPAATATDGGGTDGQPEPSARKAKEQRSFARELPVLIVIALGLALLIRTFLVQAFYIPSGSMQQTLDLNDRVLVNKLVYDFREIRRGEIVVFNASGSLAAEPNRLQFPEPTGLGRVTAGLGRLLGTGAPGETDYIKRVIGLPGDRVACCTAEGQVTVQPPGGVPVALDEPYVFVDPGADGALAFCEAGEGDGSCPVGATGVLVPEGRLWVMGDHRNESSDSRAARGNGFDGTVPEDQVIGRAFVVVWPLNRLDVLSVPEPFTSAAGTALGALPLALGLAGALPARSLLRRARALLRR